MKHETLIDPDLKLAAQLIARKLTDRSIEVNAEKIAITVTATKGWRSQVFFRYLIGSLAIRIQSEWHEPGDGTASKILELADRHVAAIERTWKQRDDLLALLKEAKAAAKREIAKAGRRGCSWKLLSVEPSLIDAEAEALPVAEVNIEMLDRATKADRYDIIYDHPADFSRDLAAVLEAQTIRAARKKLFTSEAAGGAIDRLVLNVLRHGRMDVADVIRRMREDELGFIQDCDGTELSLWWDDGRINATFSIGDEFSYVDGTLTTKKAVKASGKRDIVGKMADDVFGSPLLAGMQIEESRNSDGRLVIALKPNYHLFDDQTCEPRDTPFEI